MKKVIVSICVLLGLGLVVVLLAFVKGEQFAAMGEAGENFQLPPSSVSSAVTEASTWPKFYTAVGSVSAAQGITVSAEFSGVVVQIAFESGQDVEEGDLLISLDTSTEVAQLKAAQAQAELAQIGLDRAKRLRADKTVAQSELDAAEAQYFEAAAQVENIQAVIGKKEIRAPFSGRLGIRQVNEGQFVNVGTPIVSLQSLDTMYVDFSLPQRRLSELSTGMVVEITSDSFSGKKVQGELSAINPEIDVATRSVRLRGTFNNAEDLLLSGMFVNISVFLNEESDVVIIPATAILYAPYGESVFIINEGESGKTVTRSFVRIGDSRGDFVSVLEGLDVGDEIVASGVFKLRNGSSVVINNGLVPDAQLNPNPEDA
ncbi:efflux RND transporter periplasmic adaptor subunit [Puniceicoccaceae bacterium K14]|nr:efflux RND transporter periplasmic adaptor subunit [Puniceicoccaceae bacterium K14]